MSARSQVGDSNSLARTGGGGTGTVSVSGIERGDVRNGSGAAVRALAVGALLWLRGGLLLAEARRVCERDTGLIDEIDKGRRGGD